MFLSKVTAEKVWPGDLSLPPLEVVLPDLLWEQDKDDKDEETLEGHKDGEDVSEGKELVNFYHQNSNDPSDTHHHSQRDRYLQPVPVKQNQFFSNIILFFSPDSLNIIFVLLPLLMSVHDNNSHYEEANVSQDN